VDLMNEAIDRALEGEGRGTREAAAALEYALAICAGSRRQWHTVPEGAYATYQRCRHYLLRHYPSLPSVEAAARACSITAPYLTRLFQRYEKETPHACLHRLRMNEAMLRLQEPRVQVKGVAFGLRFKSPAHFSRAFKSFHGVLPNQVTQLASET
jgi:AraC-like DNA-binding protein